MTYTAEILFDTYYIMIYNYIVLYYSYHTSWHYGDSENYQVNSLGITRAREVVIEVKLGSRLSEYTSSLAFLVLNSFKSLYFSRTFKMVYWWVNCIYKIKLKLSGQRYIVLLVRFHNDIQIPIWNKNAFGFPTTFYFWCTIVFVSSM